MKFHKILSAALIFFALFTSLSLSAQDDREDVVYLKDGSIYRGIIVEQMPGVSLKVETIGGNVFNVQISDIIKLTKEKKVMPTPPPGQGDRYGYGPDHGYGRGDRYFYHHMRDSSGRYEFHDRKKGYFNTVQFLIENMEGGGRMVNGYKFGRLGYLGIGIGVDFIFKDMHGNSDYSGVYLPLYLHYGGDILKKRITPFYSIEVGYAMRVNQDNNSPFAGPDVFNNNSNFGNQKGGLMGGLGFGVKFKTRHKVFFSLSAHADFQQASHDVTNYLYDPAGNYYTTTNRVRTTMMIPGIRLGIGF